MEDDNSKSIPQSEVLLDIKMKLSRRMYLPKKEVQLLLF